MKLSNSQFSDTNTTSPSLSTELVMAKLQEASAKQCALKHAQMKAEWTAVKATRSTVSPQRENSRSRRSRRGADCWGRRRLSAMPVLATGS